MSATVIEKDFWICWILKQFCADSTLGTRLVFKGGPSLSKAYTLIDRFSEDLDLILDVSLVGGSATSVEQLSQCDRLQ